MALQNPLINGFYHSWASIEIRCNGNVIQGFTEINYSPGLEPGIVFGAGAEPIGRTLGQASYEGDFTLLLAQFNELITALGENFLTKSFDVVVSYSSPEIPDTVDTLKGCRITKVENGASTGSTDAVTRKCTLSVMRILLNGLAPGPNTAAPFQG